jgi:hypothetical protein
MFYELRTVPRLSRAEAICESPALQSLCENLQSTRGMSDKEECRDSRDTVRSRGFYRRPT